MNQCLSCNRPCVATAVFCDSCRASLLNRQQVRDKSTQVLPPATQSEYAEIVEQIKVNHKPHLFTKEDLPPKNQPKMYRSFQKSALPTGSQDAGASQLVPANSPELEKAEEDHSESDVDLMQGVDPLLTMHLPNSTSAAHSDEEDIQPIHSVGKKPTTVPLPVFYRYVRSRPLRIAFITLVVAIVLALIVDAVLITFIIQRDNVKVPSSPMLAVTPNVAHPGQTVLLQISHFSAFTHVLLTRDIQGVLQTDTGSPLIALGATGSASVHILVDNSWGAGPRTIEGEDIITHYTTSTTIQVVGAGPVVHAHLALNATSLDMGADLQGANTIQQFVLRNSGGSLISWAASSNQPWLMETPAQGVFSDSQSVAIAVTRANLKPGNYNGSLTIASSTNTPAIVRVKMTVLPLPAHPGAVLQVTPPVLSFTSTDGGRDPAEQLLTISNPGSQPLSWSNAGSTPMGPGNAGMPFKPKGTWLSTAPTSGMVAPGSTALVHVTVHSQELLGGVYGAILTFASAGGVLNNPQHVAVSLTVQPRLPLYPTPGAQSTNPATPVPGTSTSTSSSPGEPILAMSTPNLAFTYTQGQNNPGSQKVTLANMGSSAFSWQASAPSSASSWLSVGPNSGKVAAAQSAQIEVSVNAAQLTPGKYDAQVQVYAADSSGRQLQNSPQTLTVTLFVSAPCSLQVSPSNLAFTVSLLQPGSASQNITLKETGNCVQPVSWSAQTDRGWLILSNTNGTDNGSITIHANAQGMLPGTYSAQITLSASDSNKVSIQVNPQTISVTLQVNAT
jgi:Viral BACON domain